MAAPARPPLVLRPTERLAADRAPERGRWRRAAALSLLLHASVGSFVWMLSYLAAPPPEAPPPIRVTLLFEGSTGGDGEQGGGNAAATKGDQPPLPEGETSNSATVPEPSDKPPSMLAAKTPMEQQSPVPVTGKDQTPPAAPLTTPQRTIDEGVPRVARAEKKEKQGDGDPVREEVPTDAAPAVIREANQAPPHKTDLAPVVTAPPPPSESSPTPSTAVAALPKEDEAAQPTPASPLRVEKPVPSETPPEPAERSDPSRAPPNARTATPAPPRHNAGEAPPLVASTRPTPPPPPGNQAAPKADQPLPPAVAAWPVLQKEAVAKPPAAAFKGLPRAGDDSRLPPASMARNDRRLDPDLSGLPAAPRETMQMASLGGGEAGAGVGTGAAFGPGAGSGPGGGDAGGRGHARFGAGDEDEIEELQRQIDRLLLVFTPSHPDVVRVQQRIDTLRRRGGLTSADLEAVNKQVSACLARQPTGSYGGTRATIELSLRLDASGAVRSAAPADTARLDDDPAYAQVARAAAAAVKGCGPFRLPAEKYEAWQHLALRVLG